MFFESHKSNLKKWIYRINCIRFKSFLRDVQTYSKINHLYYFFIHLPSITLPKKRLKTVKKTNLFIALVFFQLWSMAQNSIPPLTYLTTEKGLSQAISYDIFQDSRGIMWFTSYDGLNKFDSNKIIKYTYDYNDKNSFWGNLSIGVVEDKKGNIWTGGSSGLNSYQYHQNKFKHVTVNDKSDFYHYPLFATQNWVVFQKGNRFYSTDITTFKTQLFFVDKAFQYTNFSSKTFETQSSYFVFTKGKSNANRNDERISFRVYEFKKNNLKQPKITPITTSFDTKSFQELPNSKYLIGTNLGLCVFDLKTKKTTPYLPQQFKADVTAIDNINAHQFLISTKNGELYQLDCNQNKISLQTFFF